MKLLHGTRTKEVLRLPEGRLQIGGVKVASPGIPKALAFVACYADCGYAFDVGIACLLFAFTGLFFSFAVQPRAFPCQLPP